MGKLNKGINMKKMFFLLFLLSFNVFSKVNCEKHPIYCQIKNNKSSLENEYAMKLSNIIYKMHKKYKIPVRIFTAILMQESSYDLSAKGCNKGLYKDSKYFDVQIQKCLNPITEDDIKNAEKCLQNINPYKEKKICSDFGISQIYYKTAKRFGFNIFKLNSDLEYSVEAGAIVLNDFMKKYKNKDVDWWVRYNCGVRGNTKRDTCLIYKKLVQRYM
jgi:hypothetical protein